MSSVGGPPGTWLGTTDAMNSTSICTRDKEVVYIIARDSLIVLLQLTPQQASCNPLHWKSLPELLGIHLSIEGFSWLTYVTDWINKQN